MAKQIIVNAVFNSDGSFNRSATDALYGELADKLAASTTEDFDTVSVEITTFLLQNPGLKTIPTSALVRSLWEQKVEDGQLKGKSTAEKNALYARLEEVVPEYVKGNPDMFHMGRKTGIAIRYVPGEVAKDAKGNDVFDGEGNAVQAYRHSDEDWTKLTAVKAAKADANGAAVSV